MTASNPDFIRATLLTMSADTGAVRDLSQLKG